MKVYKVNLKLRYHSNPNNPINLINAWSGSFSLKIVYDYFKRIGIDFEKESNKPFLVDPLIHNGKYILTGLYIKENDEFKLISAPFLMRDLDVFDLNIIFLNDSIMQQFLEAFTKQEALEEPSGIFIPVSLSVSDKELPKIEFGNEEEWTEFKIQIEYLTPTNFAFHGQSVLFPSHIRLLYSISKDISEFIKQNFKEEIEKIILNAIELNEVKIKRVFVDIGEGRKVPCFIGSATYFVCTKQGYIKALTNLFAWAEVLGVGKSRTLGFGRVKINTSVS